MGWSFFTSAGVRKLVNFNSGAATPVAVAHDQVGLIVQTLSSSCPDGWLLCDGTAVSRTAYSGLFATISTTYGSGDGSTTFNLPNLSGRAPIGDTAGAQDGGSAASGAITGGTAITSQAIGTYGGATRVKLTAAQSATDIHSHPIIENTPHHHTISDPGHSHNLGLTTYYVTASTSDSEVYPFGPAGTEFPFSHYLVSDRAGYALGIDNNPSPASDFTISSTSADAADFHENMEPYVALTYMIKY